MSDLISRQAAIDAIEKYFAGLPIRVHADMLAIIHGLPSAQPQRKTGKWITVNGRFGDEVECDKCKSVFWYWMGNYRYCPSCGARMDGESDD